MTGRRTLIALTLVVVVLGTAGPATAATRTRSQIMRARMIYLLNVSRREHGIPPLHINLKLSAYAWQHSRNMAIQDRVYHTSSTWAQVQHYGARSWGENVGMSWDLGVLEHAFMLSPPHRENILAARFHYVGIGVVLTRHYRYVTIDFYG
jgi:uncharacterized protein YkwD